MFHPVVYWCPADEPPFDYKVHYAKPLATMEEAQAYAHRAVERAELSDVWLSDVAVFDGEPRDTVVDHEHQLVHDYAAWRLHGRQTYSSMFF